jgi:hypothetical protein
MENKKITAIFVDDIGWVYADNAPIEVFMVNGEMALVTWYKKAKEEYNGRYVKYIRYE